MADPGFNQVCPALEPVGYLCVSDTCFPGLVQIWEKENPYNSTSQRTYVLSTRINVENLERHFAVTVCMPVMLSYLVLTDVISVCCVLVLMLVIMCRSLQS